MCVNYEKSGKSLRLGLRLVVVSRTNSVNSRLLSHTNGAFDPNAATRKPKEAIIYSWPPENVSKELLDLLDPNPDVSWQWRAESDDRSLICASAREPSNSYIIVHKTSDGEISTEESSFQEAAHEGDQELLCINFDPAIEFSGLKKIPADAEHAVKED